MKSLAVWRMKESQPEIVGRVFPNPIRFEYDEDYLLSPEAHALSLSLPLKSGPYDEDEMSPYFNGLLPENETRTAIAKALNTVPDDFLAILLSCGREIIGDIAITEGDEPVSDGSYEPLSTSELSGLFAGYSSLAESNRESRLSLAGSQGKTGLAHIPEEPMDRGWFRPLGGAASTHVLKTSTLEDIPLLEFLCMRAARELGVKVPSVDLLELNRPIFCVERFDRIAAMSDGALRVARLHQEDLAQAFGIPSRAKYAELSPTTGGAIAGLLRDRSSNPVDDLEEFAKVALFNYLVGNCDNHLKNTSILYNAKWSSLRLAPAYDIVSTTRYERFSTEMGMSINGKREIGEIQVEDWLAFSREIGIHPDETASFCARFSSGIFDAINGAAKEHGSVPELAWVADDLCEEMYDRWRVLDEIAKG